MNNMIRSVPLVSFIIAIDELSEIDDACIHSIFLQGKEKDFEIIVVQLNAGNMYEKHNPYNEEVIVIRSNKALSVAQAYNQGLMRATGRYVAFITGKERFSFNLISILSKEISKNNVDIAVIPYINISDVLNSNLIRSIKFSHNYYHRDFQRDKKKVLSGDGVLYLSNKLFSRDFLLKINNKFSEDILFLQTPFILFAYLRANIIVGLNGASLNYVIKYKLDDDYQRYIQKYHESLKFLEYVTSDYIDKLSNINDISFFYFIKYLSNLNNKSNLNKKNNSYDVAVIVPVYNTEAYVEYCIKSILNQSLKNLQIVVVNDGSLDNSLNIINKLALDYENIQIIDISLASGHPGTPRNLALMVIDSQYVGYVDSDDWIEPSMIEKLYMTAKKKELDICSTSGYFRCTLENEVINHSFVYIAKSSEQDWRFLENNFFSNIWNRLYSVNLLKNNGIYFPSLYLSEDFCFSAIAHYYAKATGSIDGSFYHYRYNLPKSTTSERQGEKGLSILEDFAVQMKYFLNFDLKDDFVFAGLKKQLGSFWYTHDRLDPLLRPLFKIKLKEVLLPFESRFNYDELIPDTRGRLKKLFSTKETSDSLLMAEIGLDLYRLKKGRQLQLNKNYFEAEKVYNSIHNERLRYFNSFVAVFLNGNIIKSKVYLNKLLAYSKEYDTCKFTLLDFYKKKTNQTEKKSQYILDFDNILISVIIPIYNSAKYLDKCLQSVITQSYSNLEIILVNDGSTDESLSIIKKYKTIDHRIVVLNNEVASGNPGKPRNDAIKIAKGDYIAFIDSDDFVSEYYYENFINQIKTDNLWADVIFASGYYDFIEGKSVKKIEYDNSLFNEVLNIFYRYHQSFTIWDKIYKSSFIKNNNIYLAEIPAAVDVPFVFKCYIEAKDILFCKNNFGYHYRRESDSSVTVNKRKKTNCFFEFEAYRQVMSWLNESTDRLYFKPIVDFKKISSYLYTLTLIADEYKADFYTNVREEFLDFDRELMIELLKLSNQSSKLSRFEKILDTPLL